jgi:Acyclic terpene utilisation family protein AtuA
MNVAEIRAIAPSGAVGAGFDERSFWAAMDREQLHFIGCDSGSTDPGPYPLGEGVSHWDRLLFSRDLRIMLKAARQYEIPLLIGSAASAGADPNLAWAKEVLLDIAREEGLHFRLALIHSEQDRDYLKQRLREGRIHPLKPAPPLDEDVIDRSSHIVGMMGVEPFQEALEAGAQVVLAGRASDTSIFSAIPVRDGFPAGLVWHAAKVLECGGASVVRTTGSGLDGMIARITNDYFEVEPPNPELMCSPVSVASHTLYENRSPSSLVEPSGTLDVSNAVYEPINGRGVRVRGSKFIPADQYTIKLEGAELVGHQCFVVGGIRDPGIIRQFDSWLDEVKERAANRVRDAFHDNVPKHDVVFRVYGKNAVLGELEPTKQIHGHELCLIIEVIAPDQSTATAILHATAHIALHHPIPSWSGLITALAYPYAPSTVQKGRIYRFNMHHVVVPEDPREMFPIEYMEV